MSVRIGGFTLVAALLGGLVAGWGLAGCGDSGTGLGNQNDGGPGPDTATIDASLLDAAPDPDGALPDGTVPDAALDGAVIDPDNDQDGYPASQDCDDSDVDVYPGVRRDCQSDCDNGTQTCLLTGAWSTCTARTDCDCTNPGNTRVVDCGNCGQASQECGLDLHWGFPGTCLNQGECGPGQQDQVTCSFCGSGERLCQNDCSWGPPDCTGECEPGLEETTSDGCTNPWEHQLRTCDAQCGWDVTQPCTGDCLIPARVEAGNYDGEVCIAGGEFIQGRQLGTGNVNDEPARTVALSPYFIDIYEVTNARYRECVDAGGCSAPLAGMDYYDAGTEIRPVTGVTYAMAMAFCNWDGGRTLPTEAQWEKAARGPAPREVLNPWGDDLGTCELCGGQECIIDDYHSFNVGAHPLGASYYGVQDLAGNVGEWTTDWYSDTYYSTGVYFDPSGPAIGTQRVLRGLNYTTPISSYDDTSTFRGIRDPGFSSFRIGLRCVRSGY
jgi:formylglycine-generating enzyme required for sulfatase activity